MTISAAPARADLRPRQNTIPSSNTSRPLARNQIIQHCDPCGLIDLRDKIPRGLNSIDLMVTVEPFYARFYIYQPGFPDSLQHCCGNKPASVIKVPVVDGRFCVRQSQPKMKWTVRALFRPDIQM